MHFNSVEFFLFLGAVLVVYYATSHRTQNRILLIASYVFYGWWDVRFLFLIVASTVLDYCCGLMIGRGRLTATERLRASLYLLGASVVFLGMSLLAHLPPHQLPAPGSPDWGL